MKSISVEEYKQLIGQKPKTEIKTPRKRSELELELSRQMKLCYMHPEEEYKFLTDRRFRFDFAWPEFKLAVEVDGCSWANGRHNRGSGFLADIKKQNLANINQWTLLRYTGDQVKSGEALEQITEYLKKLGAM